MHRESAPARHLNQKRPAASGGAPFVAGLGVFPLRAEPQGESGKVHSEGLAHSCARPGAQGIPRHRSCLGRSGH
eukprot:8776405-Alexandrium_andersonii.AAC.1